MAVKEAGYINVELGNLYIFSINIIFFSYDWQQSVDEGCTRPVMSLTSDVINLQFPLNYKVSRKIVA